MDSDSASSPGFSILSSRHLRKQLENAISHEPSLPVEGFSDENSSGIGQNARPNLRKVSRNAGEPINLRSCDVYIGMHGRKPSLLRFSNWLQAELELQGVYCVVADRARSRNGRGLCVAERAMDEATIGVVILTKKSFSNRLSIDEVRWFLGRKNLIPIFFDLEHGDCLAMNIIEKRTEVWSKHGGEVWRSYGGAEKEWREVVDGLSQVDEWKIEAHPGNWRDCILQAVILLGMRLGRRQMIERVNTWKEVVQNEEFPLSRNKKFVGRKEELVELEFLLFGDAAGEAKNDYYEIKTDPSGGSGKLATRERVKVNKGKEPMVWKENNEEIEMEGFDYPGRDSGLVIQKNGRHFRGRRSMYGKGIACVTGDSGIGKTELVLEFAYRVHQRYQMVFWIVGESRYIRQTYLNLVSFLGIDLSVENQLSNECSRHRSFEEMEREAISRVRKEFMRNIPFLIVIDNLEAEKDWWDGRDIMDLLPRFGGETHVIISTRLPRILNLKPMRLTHMFGAEAMSLMNQRVVDLSEEEDESLRVIEKRLGGLTLGLALVGAILYELPITSTGLLNTINRMPLRDLTWNDNDGTVLRHSPFLMQLLDVCFSILNFSDQRRNMGSKMVLASGWFAPSPIPVSLLASAACEVSEEHGWVYIWKKFLHGISCRCFTSSVDKPEGEASNTLVKLGVARSSPKQESLYFHEIIRTYARKRGSVGVAHDVVQSIFTKKPHSIRGEHLWAASFLTFKFGTHPAVVKLMVPELLSFIKGLALPLANQAFTNFSMYKAALELLRLCTEALEDAKGSFLSCVEKGLDMSLCRTSFWSSSDLSPELYQDLELLKATLLELRANIMIRGGEYGIGKELCEMAINIRSVLCGWDHPDTISAQEIKAKLERDQISAGGNRI